MKIFFVFEFVILFFFHVIIADASIIKEDSRSYYVNGVVVENVATSDNEDVKSFAMNVVKRKAINDLIVYLKQENAMNDLNLNASISSFKILDERYDKDYFAVNANFVFDKVIVNNMIEGINKRQRSNNSRIVDAVVMLKEKDNIVQEYVKMTRFLKKSKLSFTPIKISNKEIQIKIYKVNEDTIYDALRKLDLNGKMYLEN